MKHLAHQLLGRLRKSWWLEISTHSLDSDSLECDYYFGPFASKQEALQNRPGYVEDLEQEGSTVFHVSVVRRTTPHRLTVEHAKVA